MNEFYEEKPFAYGDSPKNTEDEFFGEGWSVRRSNNKCFFTYISGGIAGNPNEVEISEEDFNLARNKQIGFDKLCIKYHVS